ncbi:hypothetical protein OHS71_08675 [Streptomyces sp. NBC_00377]|uniref:hypothetical protein n=1 Tax=unclassified Streptomyces TaxID=2593676 RepID=UPI002E1B2554|nr:MULTISPECIES: hypothetical protein [unclassified Streptomyces]
MATSQGEALICDDSHAPKETSEHFLTRDRQRADEHAADGPACAVATVTTSMAAASSAPSPPTRALRWSKPVMDLSPAAVQVFRC